MDAGTAMHRARLRQHLLNGEQDIDALSSPMYSQQTQPNQQASYSNHDIMTPLPAPNSGPRKGSLTSQSGMNRFFRRGREPGNFNEDLGADIQELTNGANVSFEDISHIRNRGPYGMTGSHTLDTTPIIPTLGPAGSNGKTPVNNIQYRKQMNQQKKMALASGARAMSLASGNPMNQQQFQGQNQLQNSNVNFQGYPQVQYDPRSMSLGGAPPANYNRAMSLNSNPNFQQGPRAMSLNTRQPMNNNMNNNMNMNKNLNLPNTNGPRSMSMRSGPYNIPGAFPQPGPNGRSMSLTGQQQPQQPGYNPYTQQQQQQFQQQQFLQQQQQNFNQQQYQQAYPRSKSLNSNAMLQQQNFQQQNNSLNNRSNPLSNSVLPPVPIQNNFQQSNSNDSLMNVVEEEEDNDEPPAPKQHPRRVPPPISPTSDFPPQASIDQDLQHSLDPSLEHSQHSLDPGLDNKIKIEESEPQPLSSSSPLRENSEHDDEDAIYKFDEEDNDNRSISRMSTIKKSNSMRLRKLNLFSNEKAAHDQFETKLTTEREVEEEDDIDLNEDDEPVNLSNTHNHSPSFNIRNDTRESMLFDENEYDARRENREKFKSIGATASNTSTSTTKDVFLTASDITPMKEGLSTHTTPFKPLVTPGKALPSPNLRLDEESDIENEQSNTTFTAENPSDRDLKERGSPDFTKPRIPKNNFIGPNRSASTSSQNSPAPSIKSIRANTAFNNFRTSPHDGHSHSHNDDLSFDSSEKSLSHINDITPKLSGEQISGLNSSNTVDKFSDRIQDDGSHYSGNSIDNGGHGELVSHQTTNKSADIYDQSTPPTPRTTYSNGNNYSPTYASQAPPPPPMHNINTNVPVDGFMRSNNTNDLINSPLEFTKNVPLETKTKEKRSSRNFSLTNKSMNIFKRLSKSSKRASGNYDEESVSSKSNRTSISGSSQVPTGAAQQRRASGSVPIQLSPVVPQHDKYQAPPQSPSKGPLTFTKQELHIMNCNNDLLLELELVTTELASSIKRELALENKLKNSSSSPNPDQDAFAEVTEKSRQISDLQEKLNKERRLRFISEEHALLSEHGQTPSPLKLNYEKTELYKQLLIKNDLVNQLEDKLQEYEGDRKNQDQKLLDKYNELLNENSELKFNVIPDLERRLGEQQPHGEHFKGSGSRQFTLLSNEYEQYDESQEEISTLKHQRDELREVVSQLRNNHRNELKLANDKVGALEKRLQDMKAINDKLSGRPQPASNTSTDGEETPTFGHDNSMSSGGATRSAFHVTPPHSAKQNFTQNSFHTNGKSGKLSGFTIVSPTKKFFD